MLHCHIFIGRRVEIKESKGLTAVKRAQLKVLLLFFLHCQHCGRLGAFSVKFCHHKTSRALSFNCYILSFPSFQKVFLNIRSPRGFHVDVFWKTVNLIILLKSNSFKRLMSLSNQLSAINLSLIGSHHMYCTVIQVWVDITRYCLTVSAVCLHICPLPLWMTHRLFTCKCSL